MIKKIKSCFEEFSAVSKEMIKTGLTIKQAAINFSKASKKLKQYEVKKPELLKND
jgi:hypothetical protein